jgi:hypothetical protein
MGQNRAEVGSDEWVTFPGGELEGKRPRALCPTCREALKAAVRRGTPVARKTLCFQCYRADLERERALKSAGALETGSDTRLQFQLPFEPVNRPRLEALKAARASSRAATPQYIDRRRHAQIEARHALARIAAGLQARGLAPADRERAIFQAVHAAELQLPDSWIPFVVAR